MLVKRATTQECEAMFKRDVERRGYRFDRRERYERYKKRQRFGLISIVQSGAANSGGGTATITFGAATQAGNLLMVMTGQISSAATTATITDSSSGGNTWALCSAGYATQGSNPIRHGVFFVPNAVAVTSVTATWSAGNPITHIIALEISGLALSSSEDASVNTATFSSAASIQSAALTTANANDILLHFVTTAVAVTSPTAGGGFALQANDSQTSVTFLVVSSTQSGLQNTTSWTTASVATSTLIGLKAAASGGPSLVALDFTPGCGGTSVPQGNVVSY